MRFTIVTATYNRAHTLGRVFESLCQQTFRDFEWIVVDDGSTDGTRELVSSWRSFFPIRYTWKQNAGKHTAVNLGVAQAAGEFLTIVDSDDCCTPHALERLDYLWRQIPEPYRFGALAGLCARPDGTIIGKRFPADCVDTFTLADQIRMSSDRWGHTWDRWGIARTDVLREFFPYPEGERFCPEGLIWNRIARKYAARFVNEVLLVVYPSPGSLSQTIFDQRATSPRSTLTFYRELALAPAPLVIRVRAAINFCRFAALAGLRRVRRRPGGGT